MDHFDPALISVVMPCHNAADTVEAAVASVLAQRYAPLELIIVDDGSTDRSTDRLRRLAAEHPGRIALVFESRSGPYAARNAGLAQAHGNFIAFLDADDAWHPDALARLHAALEVGPAEVAWCGWQAFGEAVAVAVPQLPPEPDAADAAAWLFEHGAPPLNTLLIRRPLLDALRGFSERAPSAMGLDFWLRLMARAPVCARVPEALAWQRQYPRPDTRIPRWRQVVDGVAVRREFAQRHPDLVARFTPARLHALVHDPLLREGYRCHWRNDTDSARRLFRRAFGSADWTAGDLKHLVASLLPAPLYRNLVNFVTRRRSDHTSI